ncbi:MAG: hypothetical protein AABM43_12910, partial [Actinomycetota bacterium]
TLHTLDATENVTIAAADPSNPRVDRVVVRVRDAFLGDVTNEIDIFVVAGTPTGGATLTNCTGAGAVPGSSLLIANVLVDAAASSIVTAKIDTTGASNNNPLVRPAVGASGASGSSLIGVQILTSSGTYTPTTGTTRVYVELVAGGGAGGGCPAIGSGSAAGGGGGGGGYAASLLTSGFSGVSYVIGAGGTGVSAGAGNAGSDTTWNATTIVAKSGAGGAAGVLNTAVFGGAGGIAGTGQVTSPGGRGTAAINVLGNGAGGSSYLGFGAEQSATPSSSTLTGNAGSLYGGGGSGGQSNGNVGVNTGGPGAAGIIRVWEFR